jgi:hypothetical protein
MVPEWRRRLLDDGLVHLFDRHSSPRFHNAAERGRRAFRQQHDRAVRMHKKLHAIAGLELQVIANRFRDCRLALAGYSRLHVVLHYNS